MVCVDSDIAGGNSRLAVTPVRIWILISALLVASGWILSACHELNAGGYGVIFALAAIAAIAWQRRTGWRPNFPRLWHKFRKRYKRAAPMLFLLLFLLSLIGGILYPPPLDDAAMYRTPRVLHWLAAEHWHWIRTFDIRMNISGCGFEWLTAPVVLFTHTDRLLFLINLISYALLPGLAFSVFRQLRVPARMAWWWMWLLPAGLCYVFQAAMLSNDAFVAIYALASVGLALRARATGYVADLWISMLAAALITGAKVVFIPLIALWFIAALPAWRLLLQRPAATAGVILLSLLISALPMVGVNLLHDSNWAGIPNHPGPDWIWENIPASSPFWGVVGNSIAIPVQNLAPPFFPVYGRWNEMMQRFVESPLGSHFASFPGFSKLKPFQDQQDSGLGFALCLLLAISLFGIWRTGERGPKRPDAWQIRLLRLAPWALLVLFMAKVASFENARQLAPYYPFLLPSILRPATSATLARRLWWQRLAGAVMVTPAILLILSPLRPLWPAQTILSHLPPSRRVSRAQSFYSSAQIVSIQRHAFQNTLPAAESVVGYATDIRALEPTLWRPFTRRVARVLPGDTRQTLEENGIHHVVVDDYFLKMAHLDIKELAQRYNARVVDTLSVSSGWQRPPDHIYLLCLNPSD